MQRQIVKTISGFRIYGAFSCIMDIDNNGEVIYSNVKPCSAEYAAMLNVWRKRDIK